MLIIKTINFLKRFFALYSESQISFLAGAISYFTFFSMFPLLILLTLSIGWLLGENAVSDTITVLEKELPFVGALISRNLATVLMNRPGTGLLAAGGLLWGSLGIFYSVEYSLNRVFSVEKTKTLTQTLTGYLLTMIVIGTLLLLSVLTSILAFNIGIIFGFLNLKEMLTSNQVIIFLQSVLFSMAAALIAYRAIPSITIKYRPALIGAAFTALTFEVLNFLFSFYINFTDLTITYGNLAPFATLMIWLYFSAAIFLVGSLLARMLA